MSGPLPTENRGPIPETYPPWCCYGMKFCLNGTGKGTGAFVELPSICVCSPLFKAFQRKSPEYIGSTVVPGWV